MYETSDVLSEFLSPTLQERYYARTNMSHYTCILTYFRGGSCKYWLKEYYPVNILYNTVNVTTNDTPSGNLPNSLFLLETQKSKHNEKLRHILL